MNLFSGKNTLLLDFDGTLGDTFDLHEAAFLKTLMPYQLAFRYKDYIGQRTEAVFQHIFEQAGKKLPVEEQAALVAAKRQAANDLYPTHLKFIAGAEAFVHAAYELGYRLYVGSSGSRKNIMSGIKGLGLEPYISGVMTADDVTHGKPHPEIFTTLLQKARITAGEALVVEDAPSGIAAALAAGIDVVCVDPAQQVPPYDTHPNVIFASFEALLPALISPALPSRL